MTQISPATWADLEYGRLAHPVPNLVQGLKAALEKTNLYESLQDSTGTWVKLKDSVRQDRLFVYAGNITEESLEDAPVLEAMNDYWWESEKSLPRMPYDRTVSENRISNARGYKKLLWIRDLLFRARYSEYVPLLRTVAAPAFFSSHPRGRIHVIQVSKDLHDALQTIDVLGISQVYSLPEIRQNPRRSVTTGQGRHLGSAILQAALSAFHPNLYGLVAERFSFLLVFQCAPVLRVSARSTVPPLHDVLRGKRLLEPNLLRGGAVSNTKEGNGVKEARLRHVTGWRKGEIAELIVWTVRQINAICTALINPVPFLRPDATIDFIKQRQYYLTIDRIMSETLTVNSEEDTFVRKLLFFDVLDKYATLSAPKLDFGSREKTYLRLLKKSHFKGRIEPLMAHMPSGPRSYLATSATEIYDHMVREAVEGIWSEGRVDLWVLRLSRTTASAGKGLRQSFGHLC